METRFYFVSIFWGSDHLRGVFENIIYSATAISDTETVPPAFSIATLADAETPSAVTVNAVVICPLPRIFRNLPFSRIIRRS